MADDALLVCMPIETMQGEPVRGSAAMLCDECEAGIWVAPSSQHLLNSGDAFLLVCTRCAVKEQYKSSAVTGVERKSREIDRLRSQAESAYNRMFDARDDRAAKRENESAYDALRTAARLARELDRLDEALALERRADHIRKVYRQQFKYPPDLLN